MARVVCVSDIFWKGVMPESSFREINLALLRRRVTKHFNAHLMKCECLKALVIASSHNIYYPGQLQIDLLTSQGKIQRP